MNKTPKSTKQAQADKPVLTRAASTKLHRASAKAVQNWCTAQGLKLISKPRHVKPRSYVIGHAAERCLVVAECWADAEPQLKERTRAHPLNTVHVFDTSLKAGDWCITAYVNTKDFGQTVAVPIGGKP